MFSEEQRKAALELFIKYDRSYADTIAELGYPSRHTLRQWWSEYEKTGEVPSGKRRRKSKYDESARRRAADYYIGHGKSLSRTMRALGYPKSKETLAGWIDEFPPGRRKLHRPKPKKDPVPVETKSKPWPSSRRGREPPRKSRNDMGCRESRPTHGEGASCAIMMGRPKGGAAP